MFLKYIYYILNGKREYIFILNNVNFIYKAMLESDLV